MMEGSRKEENLPPGFRFHPTDEELINFYLTRKIKDTSFTSRAIGNVDLNKCEPWDLPGETPWYLNLVGYSTGKAKMGEKEWYFFSLRDRKYPTGLRTNRATDAGYWKTTGKDKAIYDSTNSELAGMKKTLVFYKGRAPKGEKTNWVMHEYRIQPNIKFKNGKDEWVVCRVFKKSSSGKKFPPNPTRAIPFNLDASSAALSSLLQQEPCNFNLGRGYHSNVDLVDLTKDLRGPVNMNLIGQPQLQFPGTLQQLGSNLNLTALRPNALSAVPVNGHGVPMKMRVPTSTMSTKTSLPSDMFFRMALEPTGDPPSDQADSCTGLGGYWPASY